MTTCQRCGGTVFPDFLDGEDGVALPAWHCASCGDWTDQTILEHRALTVLPPPGRARTLTWDPHETEKWIVRWKSRRDL